MRPLFLGVLLSSTTALAEPTAAPQPPAPPAGAEPAPSGAPSPATPAAPSKSPAPAAPSASPSPAASAPAAASVSAAPSTPAPSAAPRGNGLTLVVVADLPEKCRHFGKLADSSSQSQALSARVSLASCLAEERVKPIVLCDCEQSVRDLEAAGAQSLALLDEVVQIGDPTTKILALQVQGNLLSSFATRILATVPQPIDASEASRTLRETRLSLIQPHVLPLQQRARTAYQLIETIARGNPQLAKNPAVIAAVRSSRASLAALAPQIAAAAATVPVQATEPESPTITASAPTAPASESAPAAPAPTAPAVPAQTATR